MVEVTVQSAVILHQRHPNQIHVREPSVPRVDLRDSQSKNDSSGYSLTCFRVAESNSTILALVRKPIWQPSQSAEKFSVEVGND